MTRKIGYLCNMEREGHPKNGCHRMQRRSQVNEYSRKGLYHITITVADRKSQVLSHIEGEPSHPEEVRVRLTQLGTFVQEELLHSISAHYPMVHIDTFVIMPEHLHFILDIREQLVSSNGRTTHLGQVIAGFKKGCNRRYWAMLEMEGEKRARQGQPVATEQTPSAVPSSASSASSSVSPSAVLPSASPVVSPSAVLPQIKRYPSDATIGRPSLFSPGYVDVMPLKEGQLQQQRKYIRNNPWSRLLRSANRLWLQPQRGGIDTALSVPAIMGYLKRECPQQLISDEIASQLQNRLLTNGDCVDCDSYGNRELLGRKLLPVVCHRKDCERFRFQKARCLKAAREGAVLVSPRIAKGEQEIIDAAVNEGLPVILIADNGMPEIYHPSETRIGLCATGRALIVTPWQYKYRHADETISVLECKAMNCIAQALCRTRDDWWI